MKLLKASIFIVIIGMFAVSCSRQSCQDPIIVIQFQGFDSVELKTVRIQKYERATGDLVVDSVMNYYNNPNGRGVSLSYHTYDYTFTINKEYKLSDFYTKQRKLRRTNRLFGSEWESCSNSLTFKQNGHERSVGSQDECIRDNYCLQYIPVNKE